jgi:hypothetical protein
VRVFWEVEVVALLETDANEKQKRRERNNEWKRKKNEEGRKERK